MRHGESEANVQEIILSDPENGVPGFGLTQNGKQQVANSVLANEDLDENTLIYSSDFARTRETAEITKDILEIKEKIVFTKLLRERFFGDFEKTSNENYEVVWENDQNDQNNQFKNVENVNQVLNRIRKLIEALEEGFNDEKFLFVSHGDPLQISYTDFLGIYPSEHRTINPLETAEIRELTKR
jgi:broad specificity phosphatase PhoE